MNDVETTRHLSAHAQRLGDFQATPRLQSVRQRAAAHEPLNEKRHVVLFTDVEKGHYICVVDSARRISFALEASPEDAVLGHIAFEELQGDCLAVRRLSAVDV